MANTKNRTARLYKDNYSCRKFNCDVSSHNSAFFHQIAQKESELNHTLKRQTCCLWIILKQVNGDHFIVLSVCVVYIEADCIPGHSYERVFLNKNNNIDLKGQKYLYTGA